tara:strand:- start:987 stop:1823 length:837 start_codon:yes stop_codon:yes gene_type:complete
MEKTFKIACVQTEPKPDFENALKEIFSLADEAVNLGAQFITLPEYCGGLKTENGKLSPPSSSENEHLVLNEIKKYSKQKKVFILLGSIAILNSDGKIYNRSYIIDDKGFIVSRYDKVHLFDVDLSETEKYRESNSVTGGQIINVCDTKFGMLGQTVCYDIRFPYLYRELSQAGAQIIFIPAVFTQKTGEAHWHVLNRARAIENGVFIVSPGAIGKIQGGGGGYGHSLVVNPWGEIISDGGDKRGISLAEINLDEVQQVRNKIPSLTHDKKINLSKSNN